jgi:hypothetical protein
VNVNLRTSSSLATRVSESNFVLSEQKYRKKRKELKRVKRVTKRRKEENKGREGKSKCTSFFVV